MVAIDNYFSVYNNDNILTINDSYKNLVITGGFYPKEYKKYNQSSEWVAADTNVYQYYYSRGNEEYEALITFDLPDKKACKNQVLAFMPPPSEDVSYFCYRIQERVFIMITVPVACEHGKSEDALKNFLARINYTVYGEKTLRKPPKFGGGWEMGLYVFNSAGEVIFSSDIPFMTIQDYLFRSIEDLNDAEEVFKKITISCPKDIEIVPMNMSQYIRVSPQFLLHYRTYIKVVTRKAVECSIRLYDLIPNTEILFTGVVDLTTSFLLTKHIY